MAQTCPNCGESASGGKLWNEATVCDDCYRVLSQIAGIRGSAAPPTSRNAGEAKGVDAMPPGLSPSKPLMSKLKGLFRK